MALMVVLVKMQILSQALKETLDSLEFREEMVLQELEDKKVFQRMKVEPTATAIS